MDKRIGCVIMAAGNAKRFNDNKLAAKVCGKALIDRALDIVPYKLFDTVVVVSQYDRVLKTAEDMGFVSIRNFHPDYGISHTIKLALDKCSYCDALMFMVSDQPMLKEATLRKLVDFYRKNDDYIVALSHRNVRGNPCIFPSDFYSQLYELSEDNGGSTVIRQNENRLKLFETDKEELTDIDTKEDLKELISEVNNNGCS